MAVQSKTLVNDVGSAVVDELASQMNRASCSTPMAYLYQPFAAAGTGAIGITAFAHGHVSSGVMFQAHEDCLVTNIKMAILGAAWTDGAVTLGLLRVPSSWTDTAGAAKTALFEQGSIHGGGDTEVGSANSTYELLFASNGNGSGFGAENTIFDLFDVTADSTDIPADDWNGTMVATNMGTTSSKSLGSSIAMNAGDTLVWVLQNASTQALSFPCSVGYRPMKDQLNLTPTFTQKTFATKAR